MDFVFDSMTGGRYQDLHKREGELGAAWARCAATPSARFYLFDNRAHCGVIQGSAGAALYASGAPPTPDYTVACNYTVKTNVGHVGIAGRMSMTANTHYLVYYDPQNVLVLAKRVNGVLTILGNSDAGTMSAGQTHTLALDMVGTTIRALVDDQEIYSVADDSITGAGRAGVRSATVNDAHIGKHIDNFRAFDASVAASPRTRALIATGL
jgi:hypothetical protein